MVWLHCLSMGQIKTSTPKHPQPPESSKKAQRKRLLLAESSLKVIQQLKESGKETHLKVRNIQKCYTRHIKCGRNWLASHFPAEDEQLSVSKGDGPKDNEYSDLTFHTAFDHILNYCFDKALSLFLTFKGFYQNLGRGTVEGIHAAFKDLWDNM